MKTTIINKAMHLIRITGAYALQLIGMLRPIDPKAIFLYSFERKGLCCNPKYIMQELINEYQGEYKLYWISRWPETVERGKGYSVVKLRSIRFYLLCGRIKFFITNDRIDETVLKRKGQIYINTWHGGGLFKKAGYDAAKNKFEVDLMKSYYDYDDYIIVSNRRLAEIFKRAFRKDSSRVISLGMPRSDIFFQKNTYQSVRCKLGIKNNKKIVLYAPTYRGKTSLNPYFPENEISKLLTMLGARFGGEWIFLYKMHYFAEKEPYAANAGTVMCCNGYYDTQELLCGVDVLVSDYSSLLWDFTLLNRPSFRYASDLNNYITQDRDFYEAYDRWPYPLSTTVRGLYKDIADYDEDNYQMLQGQFLQYAGNLDDGHASERFVEWLRTIEL